MGYAANTSTRISTSLSSDTIGASTGTSRSKPCLGSPRTITRRVTGISSGATIPEKECRQSGAGRGAEGQRPACAQTDQDLPKNSNSLGQRDEPFAERYMKFKLYIANHPCKDMTWNLFLEVLQCEYTENDVVEVTDREVPFDDQD